MDSAVVEPAVPAVARVAAEVTAIYLLYVNGLAVYLRKLIAVAAQILVPPLKNLFGLKNLCAVADSVFISSACGDDCS